MAQSFKPPILAEVIISQFMGLSPMPGSVQTAQSLEPALDSVCVCVCVCSCISFCSNEQKHVFSYIPFVLHEGSIPISIFGLCVFFT